MIVLNSVCPQLNDFTSAAANSDLIKPTNRRLRSEGHRTAICCLLFASLNLDRLS